MTAKVYAPGPPRLLDTLHQECRQMLADCTRMRAGACAQREQAEVMAGRIELLRARLEELALTRQRRAPEAVRSRVRTPDMRAE